MKANYKMTNDKQLNEQELRAKGQAVFDQLMSNTLQNYFAQILLFNAANSRNTNNLKMLDEASKALELNMIQEEVDELTLAFQGFYFKKQPDGTKLKTPFQSVEEQRRHIADALGDIIYVTLGTGGKLGMDMAEVLWAISDSNMSKFNPDGTLTFREDGKILKGPNFKEPNLEFVNEPLNFNELIGVNSNEHAKQAK